MQLGQLLAYFSTSPAVRLMNSPNAPYLLLFLHRVFKDANRIALPHSQMLSALVAYRDELHETTPNALPQKAEVYLNDWCAAETRWLQRLLEAGRDEPVYQLTPHTEEVFAFLDRALMADLGFVGTESRLKLVIDTLADLVVGASDDPEVRLAQLRAEQARVAAEIEQIEAGAPVAKYHDAQIRERFMTAVSLLRQLQGDFRAVEDSFRQITVQVQQRQLQGDSSRGGILEFALDAEDLLKREDQGVSFYAFVNLILSPRQTEKLEETIREVRKLSELAEQHEGLDTVRNMVTLLQREAEKVMRTNQRLSATLRRLLDGRTHAERRRVAQLLREIQGQATQLAPKAPIEEVGLELDLDLVIESPLRRGMWIEPPRFEAVDLTAFEPDADDRLAAFRQLAALRNINWPELRLRIRQMLALDEAPTLGDLVALHPVEGGVVEVIAYLQLAAAEGHQVDSHVTETLILAAATPDERPLAVRVPRVTFIPQRRVSHAR